MVTTVAETNTFLESAFAAIDQGVFLVSLEGLVVYCNVQLTTLIGLQDTDIIGQTSGFLFRQISALSRDQQATLRELEAACADVEQRPVVSLLIRYPLAGRLQIELFPLRDPQGNSIGSGGLIRDVTLESKEANQHARHMANLIPHLRTSLATIRGLVTSLLNNHRYWEVNEQRSFLERIFQDIDQLGQYLDNSQELFKFEAGARTPNRQPTDIRSLMTQTVDYLAFKNYGRCSLDIPVDLPNVDLDPVWVGRVLDNLVDYAVNHSPQPPDILLAAHLVEGDVVFSVAIQDGNAYVEDFALALTSSERVHPEPGKHVRTEELSLYVARELVLAHGGQIRVESSPEYGIAIRFSLPVKAPVVVEAPKLPTPPVKAKPAARQSQAALRGLLVEDDPEMLRLLRRILEADGFHVSSATSGKQALDLVTSAKPDIILMDLFLPDTNGFDLCVQLREYTSAPVLVVTGDAKPEDAVRALDLGVDDYVTKPFSPKELRARVRVVLRRAAAVEGNLANRALRIGELSIDFARRQVRIRGELVKFTPLEYKVLSFLAINAGVVISHSRLLSMVWGNEYQQDIQYLWVIISRLRKKIEKDSVRPEYVLTEPGVGYYVPAPTDTQVLLDR